MMAKDKGLKALIKHLELMQKRQRILIRLHDEHSVERAISNGKENVISLALDYANGYLIGEKWPYAMREDLERKLERGHYFNNKCKGEKE